MNAAHTPRQSLIFVRPPINAAGTLTIPIPVPTARFWRLRYSCAKVDNSASAGAVSVHLRATVSPLLEMFRLETPAYCPALTIGVFTWGLSCPANRNVLGSYQQCPIPDVWFQQDVSLALIMDVATTLVDVVAAFELRE